MSPSSVQPNFFLSDAPASKTPPSKTSSSNTLPPVAVNLNQALKPQLSEQPLPTARYTKPYQSVTTKNHPNKNFIYFSTIKRQNAQLAAHALKSAQLTSAPLASTPLTQHALTLQPTKSLSTKTLSIKNWPKAIRPRERLLTQGVECLSDAELLAIFLRTGTVGASAIDIAKQLLIKFGDIKNLLAAPAVEVMRQKGLGEAKYAHLLAAIELGKRALESELHQINILNHPKKVKDYITHQLQPERREVFAVLFLGSQLQLLAFEKLFYGGVTACQVHLREIIQRALQHHCVQLIICHNHPDAAAEPSQADMDLTYRLHQLCSMLDIQLVDHIIVGNSGSFSFIENNLCLSNPSNR